MVNAGSKGNLVNISQIIATVGQQNIEGKRIKYGFKDRTLPHFTKFDFGLESRGFCIHNYLQGLTPTEFFFHSMAGREGIIDTACKTADTGYIQRRLCKSMESHSIQYDGTVRDSLNQIIQFLYGGDGMDPSSLESQKLTLVSDNEEEFINKYHYDFSIDMNHFGLGVMTERAIEDFLDIDFLKIKHILVTEEQLLREYRDFLKKEILIDGSNMVCLPINIQRLIKTAQNIHHIHPMSDKSNLHHVEVIQKVRELVNSLIVVKGDETIAIESQYNATLLLKIYVYSNLSSKQVVFEHRLTNKALNWIIGEIKDKFYHSMATPGEMVGAIAGQSIGEPSTQMTLNTFHYAGVSAKNVTLGVPRLNEIMNLSAIIQTPQIKVHVEETAKFDRDHAKDVQSQLEYTSIRKLIKRTEIQYDPKDSQSLIDDDHWIRYAESPNKRKSKFVLRFILDHMQLINKDLSLGNICQCINEQFSEMLIAHSNEGCSGDPIIRIRAIKNYNKKSHIKLNDMRILLHLELYIFNNLRLKGIEGITRVVMDKDAHSKEWILYTEGSNYLDILNYERVNFKKTVTNNIIETFNILGVEASRQLILDELSKVYGDTYINSHHLQLLADTMSHYGELRAVSRYGICKAPTGTLMRASYEQTVDVLYDSAIFAEKDKMEDVSSNIIAGRFSRIGTGFCDMSFDSACLPVEANNSFVLEAIQSPTWSIDQDYETKEIEVNNEPVDAFMASPMQSDDEFVDVESTDDDKLTNEFDKWFNDPSSDTIFDHYITFDTASPMLEPTSPMLFDHPNTKSIVTPAYISYGPRPPSET
ncbi:hypothetical protein TRFO_33744 [Tritrichomonas foetus]|uniref:DNA-directed RNA polymerase n=1 Tax=Tritrichomonas foetus TaxID=1144522 RepID=A0A1J4JKX0_9EUKA|nr:hypothetical protein TRFO_33744 [Tritrichomonas foetus]|eukprot:OHS99752.1 hypothetical protein TRFO_33744 [Tritrichomonas foetus]